MCRSISGCLARSSDAKITAARTSVGSTTEIEPKAEAYNDMVGLLVEQAKGTRYG